MGVVDNNGNAKGSIKRALSLNVRAGQEGNFTFAQPKIARSSTYDKLLILLSGILISFV
jgi:hypothetical protein